MRTWLAIITCISMVLAHAAPALSQALTMDSLWPNDNGDEWRYDQHYEDLINALVVDNQVRIFFDGTTIVPDGLPAQYLREEVVAGPSPKLMALESLVPDPFLRQVWVARPDLREKILRAVSDSPCPENAPNFIHALLLGGEFAYRKTADDIAPWRCNLASTRSWIWLVSDLSIGNTFTLQLIPDLANDLFLHGTITSIETANVPAGTFPGCVRVDYLVDYGAITCVDASGGAGGTSRAETRGYVLYAPFVGPVQSYEEYIVTETTGACPPGNGVWARTSMRLNAPAVPVLPRSWGQLKALYR